MCQKYIIQIDQSQGYPFDGPKMQFMKVIVRKNITFSNKEQESTISRKIHHFLSLTSHYFIPIVRILERKGRYFMLDYQYVPQNLMKYHKITDQTFLYSIKDKLTLLCQSLSESCIKMELKIEDIGVSPQGEPKVFISHQFEIVTQGYKASLKREYEGQLQKILEAFFNFRNSLKAPSQLSDYSARLDKKITAIQDKINRRKHRKAKSPDSSKQSSKSIEQRQNIAKTPNIVLQSITSKLSKTAQSSANTRHSFIDPQKAVKPRTHKFSFHDYTTNSHKLNESTNREDSLTKRLNVALQKSKQTFEIYQKHFRRNIRL